MKQRQVLYFVLSLTVSGVLGFFAVFYDLDRQSLRWWDEASYALNAQEMLERKDPVVLYLEGRPELYNTKPPLAIWFMALGIRVFGFNELGIRVASAAFSFTAVLFIFLFISTVLKKNEGGFVGSLVLCTSAGFIGEHVARTGDTDSILAFWILAYVGSFSVYILSANRRVCDRALLLTALFVSFACLTKGIAGMLAVPGLLLFVLFHKKRPGLFRNRFFYVGLLIFIVLVPGYYLIRGLLQPGYIEHVLNYELGGRLQQQEYLNPDRLPFYHYYSIMVTSERYMPWVLVLPVAIFTVLFSAKTPLRTAGVVVLFAVLSISFLLGLSETKMQWYDAPLYPLFALLIGIAFAIVTGEVTEVPSRIFIWGMILVCAMIPFGKLWTERFNREEDVHLREFLLHYRDEEKKRDTLIAIDADSYFPMKVYLKQDKLRGFPSMWAHPYDKSLKQGDLLLTWKYAREVDVNKRFVLDTIEFFYECKLFRIKEIKPDDPNERNH